MQVCKTVKLRMRDRRNGTKSLFLDFWPGYRDPETMELIRRRSLGMYIYADPANKQQKLYNDKILAKAEAIRCKVYIDVLDEKYDFFNRDRLKEDFLGYFRNMVNRNYVKCDAAYKHFEKFSKGKCTFEMLDVLYCNKYMEYLLDTKVSSRGGHMQIQQPLLAEFKKGNLIQQPLLAESDAEGFQLRPELSWMHYERLMRVDDKQARIWYMNAAADNQWSYRTLGRNISTQYYYRLMQTPPNLQKKVIDEMVDKTKAFQKDKFDFIKNPVVAEFLGLPQNSAYNENKLESAIINHIQEFIMEMGRGFAFVARQQHIRTDMGDFFIDLVFYNYVLKCFLLVDLKIGQITHQDVGQMDMYVRMYDKLKCTEGDHPTVGLILCSDTSKDMAQYSILNDNKHIYQAKYLTFLPTKEELAREIEKQKEIFRLQHGEEEENNK